MYDKMAKSHPKLERGKVWCTTCGQSQHIDSAHCLQHGWPKCCGCTMTIDSPQWRAAHTRPQQTQQQAEATDGGEGV